MQSLYTMEYEVMRRGQVIGARSRAQVWCYNILVDPDKYARL